MSTRLFQGNLLSKARVLADYQFGAGVGEKLFPDDCRFIKSRRGGLRQVLIGNERLATLRAHDGRLTIGIAGAVRLHEILKAPVFRVVVQDDVSEFISAGKNVFSKHVVSADPDIRAGDELLVVDSKDTLLATGAAVCSGEEMLAFNYGAAVQVRKGRSLN